MPPTENAPVTVPLKKVLVVGLILGIFHPPVIGLIYALCFAFNKTTRRVALYVALWTIVWLIMYSFILGFVGQWVAHKGSVKNSLTPAKVLVQPAVTSARQTK